MLKEVKFLETFDKINTIGNKALGLKCCQYPNIINCKVTIMVLLL